MGGEKQKQKQAQEQEQKQAQDQKARQDAVAAAAAAAEDPQVKQVLANQELAAMLQDPGLRAKLEACGDPGTLRRHMQDADFRAKVQKLKEAGLVQIQF